ncbi:peroxiredoxin, Ohr subfamily [Deinococcus proteolyticus MRP]|uniref:Peroxiredoxin, Ohr subfamily n=1 Tax=Deinococcus proteolyticus (strain ATCC 35074 / DSM 20540 / JCM 6276 / NBRC 101906 / NCIMB 13154 / VKM Ac-1939 / CCM 2703 / MRP) TaxID=693977 RepID=F0RM52_DEIPM|nr:MULTISPECIES: Ohr family peroxiredoxin [Deinococcus]ADY25972.1 peroxiredoxin, Ohr subfamily [Deinococcus proteolyticus MRP]MCY1702093.1 Ohr family peroxiredoxin [Deinococcus sp. SL84]
MQKLYTATATAHGAPGQQVATDDRRIDLPLSLPTELGGEGGDGTNPEQLLAAGYSSCFLAALGIVSKRREVSLSPDIQVQTRLELYENGDAYDFKVYLTVSGSDVDAAQLQPLLDETLKVCPITRATQGAEISVSAG